jgi:hypothetical protein
MTQLKSTSNGTQLLFIFDCCRQDSKSARAKGNDTQTAQAAEAGLYALDKGGRTRTGLPAYFLYGARSFETASDGGSATVCSVLTQAIIDTAKNSSKVADNAVVFFMGVDKQVRNLGGYASSKIEGNFDFQFAEKSATAASAVNSSAAGGTNEQKVLALLEQLGLVRMKSNVQVKLALESNSIFLPANLQGLSAADLQEAGIPSLAAKRILDARDNLGTRVRFREQ